MSDRPSVCLFSFPRFSARPTDADGRTDFVDLLALLACCLGSSATSLLFGSGWLVPRSVCCPTFPRSPSARSECLSVAAGLTSTQFRPSSIALSVRSAPLPAFVFREFLERRTNERTKRTTTSSSTRVRSASRLSLDSKECSILKPESLAIDDNGDEIIVGTGGARGSE